MIAPVFQHNPGRQPPETTGKRVVVRLANGSVCGEKPVNVDSKIGWAADSARWSKEGSPFDIVEWRLL